MIYRLARRLLNAYYMKTNIYNSLREIFSRKL
jgi:hypothetical protein